MSKNVNVTVNIGYESRTLELSDAEWDSVRRGDYIIKTMLDYYEGQEFRYIFHFNDPNNPDNSLVVTYKGEDGLDAGEGFIGNIEDAAIDYVE